MPQFAEQGLCPYCGNDTFEGATTVQRNPEIDILEFPKAGIWANRCLACEQWSAHHDSNHRQFTLVSPDDRDSAEEP